MEKLIFATNNPHKLNEIRHILEGKVEIVGLDEIGCREDIPETADTGKCFAQSRICSQTIWFTLLC